METVLQLVVLVATVPVGPGCVRLVQSIVLVIKFPHAWMFLYISIGCVGSFVKVGMICCIGHYFYC